MAIKEAWDSRDYTVAGTSAGSSGFELTYVITGTDDETVAMGELQTTAPAIANGQQRQTTHVTRIAEFGWAGEARYGVPNPENREPEAVGPSATAVVNYSTGTESRNIKQSLQTVAKFGANTTIDFGGVINQHDEDIEGVDILFPQTRFSLSYKFTQASVTQSYILQVEELVGTVNNAAFKGRAAGEVLFTGWKLTTDSEGNVSASYEFAVSKNETNIDIGGIIVTSKEGWDYLWARYKSEVDTTASPTLVKKTPETVFVERVYERTDFSTLGIGV